MIGQVFRCGGIGITFGDPFSGFLQRLNEPSGFSFIFPQNLERANSLRFFGKSNDPARGGIHLIVAERGGFEPPIPFWGILAFQASQLSHSCISPKNGAIYKNFPDSSSLSSFRHMQA